MAVITITETSQNLKTVLPDGTIIRTDNLPVDNADQRNVIGERKVWTINYSSNVSILGNTIYINPALFVPNGSVINFLPPGANYFSYAIPETGGVNVTYECALNGPGTNPNILKNYKVYIHVITDTTFAIKIDFFMTYDANGFLDQIYQDNVSRFFKDIKTNTENFVASSPDSVYTSEDRAAKVMVYLEKYNGDNGYIVSTTNFKGIFYNTGTVTNGTFTLLRGGVPVDGLSDKEDTTIQFDVDSPNGISRVVIWMLRIDKDDPTKDFLDNYEYDWKEIVTGSADSSKLIGPFTSPYLVGGSTWRTIVLCKGPAIKQGQRYMFIATSYELLPIGEYNPGASVSIGVDVGDEPCFDGTGFNLDGRMRDYNVEWSGNDLEACIEERMQSVLSMDFTSDKWKNYLATKLGLAATNDIRRYLKQINCTIYREFTDGSGNLIKHIYAQGTVNKTSPLTYATTADIVASFPNDGTAEFTFDWRNRYETATANIQSLINGIVVPSFDNQYWGGKAFKVEWELQLFYDDYFSPFTDTIQFTQNLSVLDYGASPFMSLSLDADTTEPINSPDSEELEVCYGENLCFRTVSPNDPDVITPEPYKLITTIEPSPGNVATVEEAESWVGNELLQLTTPKIIGEQEDFGESEPNNALFCVDTTKLILNLPYKITAIAKPKFDGCIRATELLEDRITETNDTRIPEECAN